MYCHIYVNKLDSYGYALTVLRISIHNNITQIAHDVELLTVAELPAFIGLIQANKTNKSVLPSFL